METAHETGRPRKIGRYSILGEAGRGDLGVVYIAEDPRLRRRIALKLLSEAASDDESRQLFRREGRVLAALNHPNIATIHSLEEESGACFLTMELVAGETLAESLSAGSLPCIAALETCGRIADAMEAAHAKGILHRNLSSRNVKRTPEGRVKILDFGMVDARARDPQHQMRSLARLIFECLTGRHVQADQDPDWSLLPGEISGDLKEVLRRCHEPDSGQHPESIAALRGKLESDLTRLSSADTRSARLDRPGNLPGQLSSFVGRSREIEDVKRLLEHGRFVTLTGMGGCGKTRLALEAARQSVHRFPDGTWLVDLGAVRHPEHVAQAVAQILGVRDEKELSPAETLGRHLSDQETLLLLDSCEHLLAGVSALVAALLPMAPGLRVLATSREPTGAEGETVFAVPNLGIPAPDDDSVESLKDTEAVQLFVRRATQARADFRMTAENAANIASICRRLDGIPLALELAGARIRILSVGDINLKLDHRFRLLRGGRRAAHPRLQTLEAALDWSYDLLSDDERKLLRTLSVFAGGWSLESAAAVCGPLPDVPNLLPQLVQKSMVLCEPTGTDDSTRYGFLETVRQYADEKLEEAGEADSARRSHVGHMVSIAQRADKNVRGPQQATWLNVIETEHRNFVAALDTGETRPDSVDDVFTMARPLAWFWLIRGHLGFGRSVLSRVLALPAGQKLGRPRAQLLDRAGLMARLQADYGAARALHEESLALYRQVGFEPGIASALGNLANVAVETGDYEIARQRMEEAVAIYRDLGEKRGIANQLTNLAVIDNDQENFEPAKDRLEEARTIFSELGDHSSLAAALCNLGICLFGLGELEPARTLMEDSVAVYRDLDEKVSLAIVLEDLARINIRMGHHLVAEAQLIECLRLAVELGEKRTGILALQAVAELALEAGRHEVSAELLGASRTLREAMGASLPRRLMTRHGASLDSLKQRMGDAGLRKATEKGQGMSYESAVKFALGWLFDCESSGA